MNLIRKAVYLTACCFLIFTAGCGYHLVGTGSGLSKDISTIAIPVFKNNSSEPGIERDVTAKTRETFIRDGRLKVVSEEKADLIFTGEVKHYELKPVSFDREDNVTEYWVIMSIDVKVKDINNDKILVDQMFRSRWDYKVTSEVISSERERMNAVNEASRDFAERMVSIIIEGF